MDCRKFNYFKKFYNKKRLKFQDQEESNDLNSYYLMHKSKKLKISLKNDSTSDERRRQIDDSIESKTSTITHDLSLFSNQFDDTNNNLDNSNHMVSQSSPADQQITNQQQLPNRINYLRSSKSELIVLKKSNASSMKSNSESALFKYRLDSVTSEIKSISLRESSNQQIMPLEPVNYYDYITIVKESIDLINSMIEVIEIVHANVDLVDAAASNPNDSLASLSSNQTIVNHQQSSYQSQYQYFVSQAIDLMKSFQAPAQFKRDPLADFEHLFAVKRNRIIQQRTTTAMNQLSITCKKIFPKVRCYIEKDFYLLRQEMIQDDLENILIGQIGESYHLSHKIFDDSALREHIKNDELSNFLFNCLSCLFNDSFESFLLYFSHFHESNKQHKRKNFFVFFLLLNLKFYLE